MAHMNTHHHDPALDPSHEHTHSQLQHDRLASQDGPDHPKYTMGTTNEPSIIPNASPGDHVHYHEKPERGKGDGVNVNDVEKGEMGNISQVSTSSEEPDPKSHKYSSDLFRACLGGAQNHLPWQRILHMTRVQTNFGSRL